MRREFGGCAGNIAYNLKLLGGDPLIMATVGQDSAPYMERLEQLAISRRCISTVDTSYTAQAFITTDAGSNQITAFHPGAMTLSHQNQVADAGAVKLAIIAPDGRDGMLQHAQQCVDLNVPFIFDPGQGLPMFDGDELAAFIDKATWVTVNDYEGKMLCERTGLSSADISRRTQGLVVTLGGEGCEVWTQGEKTLVPPVPAREVVDPTGCGDAWRGALLYGLEQGWPLARCAELGNRVGAIKIASRGPQNWTLQEAR
jgi:adenosine kinase